MQSFLNENPRKSALMGVAGMLKTFCHNNDNCYDIPEVQKIILAYEKLLGDECIATTQKDEDNIVLSLKGLKAIRYLMKSQKTLEKCYTKNSNSMNIRLAALDTIQETFCHSSNSFGPTLLSTFSNTALDSELRIGAYLALVSCMPPKSTIDLITKMLTKEPVNQG